MLLFFFKIRRPPKSNRTYTRFPYTTLCRTTGKARGLAKDGPGGGWVARLFAAGMVLVDAGVDQSVGERGAKQQMVDAKAMIALPAAGLIVPEGPGMAGGMAAAQRVGPAVAEHPEPGIARIGLHQRVVRHRARVPHIVVVRDDVVIASEHRRDLRGEQRLRAVEIGRAHV